MLIRSSSLSHIQTRNLSTEKKSPSQVLAQFTRPKLNETDGAKAESPIKNIGKRFSPEFERTVWRLSQYVATNLKPGQAREVIVNNQPKVLHRPKSGNGLVLQSLKDFKEHRHNGLYVGYADQGRLVIMKDGHQVESSASSNFPRTYGEMACLQKALGVL